MKQTREGDSTLEKSEGQLDLHRNSWERATFYFYHRLLQDFAASSLGLSRLKMPDLMTAFLKNSDALLQ